MEAFLVRLFITIGVIRLTQFPLGIFGIKEPYAKIILFVVFLIMVLYLIGGLFISSPVFTLGLH